MVRRGRRLMLVLLAAGLLSILSFYPTLANHDPTDSTLLLPDLQTRSPTDVETIIVGHGRNRQTHIRFDNEVVNIGNGPVELYPVSQDCDGDGNVRNDRLAIQRIYRDGNANGTFERNIDGGSQLHNTGCMRFHPQHRHWHFDDFASYELYEVTGSTLGQLVASSTKVSFCIIDVHHRNAGLAGSPADRFYTECDRASTLGISIGWSDEYHSTLAGQSINITDVEDGTYCLLSTADPENRLAEVSDSNNAAGVKVTISGGGTSVTPRYPTSSDACGP